MQKSLSYDAHGNPQTLLVDAKLSGKVGGHEFHPTVDQEEMRATRGRAKGFWVSFFMGLGAKFAPNFMVKRGSGLARLFNYRDSQANLLRQLDGSDVAQLRRLRDDLKKLQSTLLESPVALIGASIIITRDQHGELHPVLIDPAHLQVDPSKSCETGLANCDPPVYFGDSEHFRLQKESNDIALTSLILTVNTALANQAARQCFTQNADRVRARRRTHGGR